MTIEQQKNYLRFAIAERDAHEEQQSSETKEMIRILSKLIFTNPTKE